MSSPKVIYYKDISNDARTLSSRYEIREVGGNFWEVKATRKEGEQEYDLVKELNLGSASPPTDEFWKEYQRDIRALQRIFEKSGKIAPEALKEWKAPYDKALEEWKNIDEQEVISRRRFWHAGGGGFYIVSRHPGTDDNPEGHGPVACFTFWKEALEAE